MKTDWLGLLNKALEVGVAIKSMSDIDKWINEKIQELSYQSSVSSALIETAYEVAKMDNDGWKYLQAHLSVKTFNNDRAAYFLNYCNYVVNLENTTIKELLSYDLREAWDIFSFNLQSMETFEIAAHFGILKVSAEHNMKARGLCQAFQNYRTYRLNTKWNF
jgi:hypothetical protein